jgi:hypothetical protein
MFPHIMRILSSPDVTIMVINITQDVKSTIITEAHSTEVVNVTVYQRGNVRSRAIAMLLSHSAALSDMIAICTPRVFLAAKELHHSLLSEQFSIHSLLKEWTSVDFTGKHPVSLQLVLMLSIIRYLHCTAQTPMLMQIKNCMPVWCIKVIFMMKLVLNNHGKLKFWQQITVLNFLL